MKTSLLALLAGLAVATPTLAADIYNPVSGSLKDSGDGSPAIGHGGFYATGFIGYAWGDRDIRQSINREAGLFADIAAPKESDYDKNKDGELSEEEREAFDEDTADFNKGIDAILAQQPGSAYDGKTLTLPFIGDALTNAGNDDIGSLVYGAELSYLFHNHGATFGFEPAIGITFYGDADSRIDHKGAQGTFTFPSQLAGQPVADFDPNGFLGQTGFASVDRELDLDFLLRGYWFLRPNLALTLGGGISVARAEICGGNTSDAVGKLAGNPQAQNAIASAFNTGFCETDTAIGPMGEIGLKWWATDRVSVVGRLDVKQHEFDAQGSSLHKINFNEGDGPAVGLYGKSNNSVEVDDTVWSAKIGVSIKLD